MTIEHGGEASDHLAPVIPLFGGSVAPIRQAPRFSTEPNKTPSPRWQPEAAHDFDAEAPLEVTAEEQVAAASDALVRKLRTKQLSVSEARDVLRTNGLSGEGALTVLDEFEHRGYLNDRTLAELLVTSGADRKGQGRVAISRTLAQRGIPRSIADEALSVLEDDDAERALEYARTKSTSLARLDDDTALRRLVGQLARRGYGGHIAMTAARTALREAKSGGRGRTSGVRFEESE